MGNITWKYPSVFIRNLLSRGLFFSVTITNELQQVDSGSKMTHIGRYTSSMIKSKGICSGKSSNSSECDSLILDRESITNTFPKITVSNDSSSVEHEAFSAKVDTMKIFYLQ